MHKTGKACGVLLVLIMVMLSVSALSRRSQILMGAVSGRVAGFEIGSIAYREIVVRNSGFRKAVRTDARGYFRISQLPIGSYQISLADEPIAQEVSVHLGRETCVTLLGGSATSRNTASNPLVTPRFAYDGQGRIGAQEIWVDDKVYYTKYEYTLDGKLKSVSDNLDHFWEYEYTSRGKISKIVRKGRGVIIFNYDKADNLAYIYLPWGLKIHYRTKSNTYSKTVTKYNNRIIAQSTYKIDEKGRKTRLAEGLGNPQVFEYSYDETGRPKRIADLSAGVINASVVSRFGRLSDSKRIGVLKSASNRGEDRNYLYHFDERGNVVFQKDKNNPIDVTRQFDELGLLVRELYSLEGRPSLDIIYKYDSFGRLIYKAQNNGIVYYYLRDKDGHLMHKIIRNTITGAEEDGIVFGPYFSEVDPDGFELIRYGDREELLVKDLEGNSRYLIEIFDALRNKLSFQQRDAVTDGDYLPNNEILMNAILEKNGPNGNTEYLNFLSKVFDFSLDSSVGSPAEAGMRSLEAGCCYRDGWCTPSCGMCFGDCNNGPGGSGSGGGGGGGGGGGFEGGTNDCYARISGPSILYKDQFGDYTLFAGGCVPTNMVWFGGTGTSMGSTYRTSWPMTGNFGVSVNYEYTSSGVINLREEDPITHEIIWRPSWFVTVTGSTAHMTVSVQEKPDDGDGDPPPPPPPPDVTVTIKIFYVACTSGYGNSFIARPDGSGDRFLAAGRAEANGQDISSQINWQVKGSAGSGTTTPSTATGYSLEFSPNPPASTNTKRANPLSYVINASVTVSGVVYQAEPVIVSQDNLDCLRQEYIDFSGRPPVPPRWDFDASPAAFQNLLATPGYGTDHRWRILAELNTHATESNETAQSAYNISRIFFTSGYRCPSGNALVGGAAASNHQLGKAFDFSGTSLKIWKSYLAARDSGAASDTYLLRNGTRYFWYNSPPPASSTVVYTLGHAAWN